MQYIDSASRKLLYKDNRTRSLNRESIAVAYVIEVYRTEPNFISFEANMRSKSKIGFGVGDWVYADGEAGQIKRVINRFHYVVKLADVELCQTYGIDQLEPNEPPRVKSVSISSTAQVNTKF